MAGFISEAAEEHLVSMNDETWLNQTNEISDLYLARLNLWLDLFFKQIWRAQK